MRSSPQKDKRPFVEPSSGWGGVPRRHISRLITCFTQLAQLRSRVLKFVRSLPTLPPATLLLTSWERTGQFPFPGIWRGYPCVGEDPPVVDWVASRCLAIGAPSAARDRPAAAPPAALPAAARHAAGIAIDADGVLRMKTFTDPGGQVMRERIASARATLDPRGHRRSANCERSRSTGSNR